MTIWCWVRDLSTNHRYDVPIGRLDHLEAIGAVEEIPGRRIRAANPRRSKVFRPLGRIRKPGRSAG